MGIIWLIEQPGSPDAVSGDLCANFPVRTVASIETMGKLISFEGQFLPNLIVCRCPESLGTQNALNMIRLHSQVPVVLLSDTDSYKISIDEKYIVFPQSLVKVDLGSFFSVVKRLIRRESENNSVNSTGFKYKHLSLDKASHVLESECGSLSERLPSKEAGILKILIESKGECVSRDLIVDRVWHKIKVGPRTVDAHISRLRRRLTDAGVQIENIYGSGYLLK